MTFKIGQVEITVTLPKVKTGIAIEIEVSAPLKEHQFHAYFDYAEASVEPLRLNLSITKKEKSN